MTEHATTPMTQADRLRHLSEHADESGVHIETLRLHLETDHAAQVFEDDDDDSVQAMHEGMHRQRITPPAPPADQPPAELVLARQEQEVERMRAAERAYDVDVPTTLREKLAYAKALGQAGIVPKAFRSTRPGEDGVRETTGNIFLATELGSVFGMHPLTALGSINVVEGKPGLGAEAQLAQALEHGHLLDILDESDDQHAVVEVQRNGLLPDGAAGKGRLHRVTFTIEDAVRAGLCRIVDGKAYARSSSNKPLPWETSTPDMLVWRAVTRACKRYLPDVTAGLAAYDGGEGEHYAPQRSTVSAEQVPARVRPAQPAADDTVEADLALFPDGRWWEHAGAQVRRRSKLQLAADRLRVAFDAGDERVPAPRDDDDVVDAEVVDDTGQPADVPDVVHLMETAGSEGDTYPSQDADAPVEAAAQVDLDPVAAVPADEPPQAVVDVPVDDMAHDDPADDDGSAEDVPDRRADLWAQVEALAAQRGKTTGQLLARHVMATRKNPEDMDADDLDAFLDAQA